MSRKVAEYLPFLGIVLFVCTASWLAGRALPGGVRHERGTRGRTISQ
ncbi:hypothetical protein ACTMTI_32700 [Nonomuraea sp. H19]